MVVVVDRAADRAAFAIFPVPSFDDLVRLGVRAKLRQDRVLLFLSSVVRVHVTFIPRKHGFPFVGLVR